MTTQHSPRVTRSQASLRIPSNTEVPSEEDVLQIALNEIRQLREQREREHAQFETLLRQRDERLRCLEQRIASREENTQISLSNNRASDSDTRACGDLNNDFRAKTGLKLKPDTFDGKVPLREFLSQFLLIARANNWDETTKTVALAANLRGKARIVLENIENFDNLKFSEIKSKLELLFGEGTQNYYSMFTNRKQKFGEDFASFGAELERLSRLAYPECSYAVRDKIACAQFISALSDGFLRRTLQLEGITSLNLAIERAKIVGLIQGEHFERKKEKNFNGKFNNFGKFKSANYQRAERNDAQKNYKNENGNKNSENMRKRNEKRNSSGNDFSSRGKECWTCGKTGHFRFECPEEKGNAV